MEETQLLYFKSNNAQFLTQDKIQNIFCILLSEVFNVFFIFNGTEYILCNVSHYVISNFILSKFLSFVFILLHFGSQSESSIQPQELSV